MEAIADLFPNLYLGFSVALSLQNLAYCFIGVFFGTVIGVLPGIGPLAAIAMLLPLTFNLPPVAALIMLAGIFYGSKYGGSTTAIMVKLPGESASVVTVLDGYEMAKQGRAGPALGISAIASFIDGSFRVRGDRGESRAEQLHARSAVPEGEEPLAVVEGFQAELESDDAGHGRRRFLRDTAGCRADDSRLLGLYAGKEGVEKPGAIR